MPADIDPKHIMWALLFLTVYDTECNSSQRLGNMDEMTYRKWSEFFVIAISYLECKVVSTHPIQHFFPREYCALSQLIPCNSHRSYGTIDFWAILARRHWSCLVVLICLLRQSFLRSSCPMNSKAMDLSTKLVYALPEDKSSGFMDQFVSFLNDNKMAVADSGYRGEFWSIKSPDKVYFCLGEEYYNASVAQACHKTVNLRFKNKQVLVKCFRHSLAFHSACCFWAVAVTNELNIENGGPLFDIQYSDKGQKMTATSVWAVG